jgi:hypothetical protein
MGSPKRRKHLNGFLGFTRMVLYKEEEKKKVEHILTCPPSKTMRVPSLDSDI